MRPRSLFWTFAGVFLLVVVTASALQLVVSLAIVRPAVEAGRRERARTAVSAAARRLAGTDGADDRAIEAVLRDAGRDDGPSDLVWLPDRGRMLLERRLPPPMIAEIHDLAVRAGLASGEPDFPAPPDGFGGPPRDGDSVVPGFRGPSPGDGRDREGGGGFGPPPGDGPGRKGGGGFGPPGDGPPPFGRGPRIEILASQRVPGSGTAMGVVAAVGPHAGSPWRDPGARALVLFVPLAVLAACVAGLLMVRILVRRLRTLERVAVRVTEGDLDARVEATGADEIGRLEAGFNRMTERLATARDSLARTDTQRRQLLADITHELATPLTSIRGYVETLMDPQVPKTDEERATYLADVLAEAERLDLLISDLLELARLEAGAQPLARVRLDWRALCRNTARRFEPRFREAGLRLEWRDAAGEAWIEADGRRMEQVAENLLTNALRYVPRGGSVTAGIDSDADSRRHRLTVSDDGPGIAPSDLPHLFERFYRARSVRDAGGSGLGLAIVQEIVSRHGGSVRADSRTPRGAAFVVEMPAA